MADWKVSAERVKVLPHPGADKLLLLKVGGYQLVASVDTGYEDGDLVVFAPERSIIPEEIRGNYTNSETGFSYLGGPHQDRVKRIRLRGEYSDGVTVDPAWVEDRLGMNLGDLGIGKDLSALLGFARYEPPIPMGMEGVVAPLPPHTTWTTHDVEQFRIYADQFVAGEDVVITEKLHGCVIMSTRIRMADGNSSKVISKIAPGDEVLGVDSEGMLISSTVHAVQRGTKADTWLKVSVDPLNSGSGSSYFDVTCTPNHPFWIPSQGKYVSASNLVVGMDTLRLRHGYALSPLQEQVLLGKMLGDGYLHVSDSAGTAKLTFGHVAKQQEYLEWTRRALGSLASARISRAVSGYGSAMIQAHTGMSAAIHTYASDFVRDRKRRIPESSVERVGPIALAFWYMDDGSLAHDSGQEDRALFAICRYDRESADVAVRILSKFGIGCTLYQSEGYNRIRLNKHDAERLFILIAPYMPQSMKYKLPERYRDSPSWLPDDSTYAPMSETHTIVAVKEVTPTDKHRWDIQTETKNFFANGVLVHNSQITAHRKPDTSVLVASKGHAKYHRSLVESESNLYWRAARQEDLFYRIARTPALAGAEVQVFGEVIPCQKGFTYGITIAATLRLFKVVVDGAEWPLSRVRHEAPMLAHLWVPVLYEGPYDPEAAVAMAEGKETVSGKALHIREGVVLAPATPRRSSEGFPLKLKLINSKYKEDPEAPT